MLEENLDVPGLSNPEQKATFVKERILQVLEEQECFISQEAILGANVIELGSKIALNLGLQDFMSQTTRPDLPHENVEAHIQALSRELFFASEGRMTRESLEMELRNSFGIKIRNPDLTRVLLYELNRARFVPMVLVLPNERKPYNPFLSMPKLGSGISGEISAVLAILSR